MNKIKNSFRLLVIEDDKSEQKLIRMIINNSGYECTLNFLNDGEEAQNYINNAGPETSKINLIFLDLNLPKVQGLDILKTLKQNIFLKHIPVVILSTSNSSSDVNNAYQSGASGFVRKPSTIEEYENKLFNVLKYWFGTCII